VATGKRENDTHSVSAGPKREGGGLLNRWRGIARSEQDPYRGLSGGGKGESGTIYVSHENFPCDLLSFKGEESRVESLRVRLIGTVRLCSRRIAAKPGERTMRTNDIMISGEAKQTFP